jgi:hypothetical protein
VLAAEEVVVAVARQPQASAQLALGIIIPVDQVAQVGLRGRRWADPGVVVAVRTEEFPGGDLRVEEDTAGEWA